MPIDRDALALKGAAIRLQELYAERALILEFLKEMRVRENGRRATKEELSPRD